MNAYNAKPDSIEQLREKYFQILPKCNSIQINATDISTYYQILANATNYYYHITPNTIECHQMPSTLPNNTKCY